MTQRTGYSSSCSKIHMSRNPNNNLSHKNRYRPRIHRWRDFHHNSTGWSMINCATLPMDAVHHKRDMPISATSSHSTNSDRQQKSVNEKGNPSQQQIRCRSDQRSLQPHHCLDLLRSYTRSLTMFVMVACLWDCVGDAPYLLAGTHRTALDQMLFRWFQLQMHIEINLFKILHKI